MLDMGRKKFYHGLEAAASSPIRQAQGRRPAGASAEWWALRFVSSSSSPSVDLAVSLTGFSDAANDILSSPVRVSSRLERPDTISTIS